MPEVRNRTVSAGIRGRVRDMFTDDLPFKALATMFAIATWAWVQGEQVVEASVRARILWNWPSELALVEDVPETLLVTVSGSQVFVRNVRQSDLRIAVDMSDTQPGVTWVDFRERAITNLPQNVRVSGLSPSTVEVELDNKTTRRVPVVAELTGEPATGYRLVASTVEPDHVELEGPKSLLAGIKEAHTEFIDIAGKKEDLTEEVGLALTTRRIRRIDEKPFVVEVDLEPVTTVKTFDGVPIVVRDKGWEPEVNEVRVVLEGPVAVLSGVSPDQLTLVVKQQEDLPEEPLTVTADGRLASYELLYPSSDQIAITSIEPPQFGLIPVR